MKAINLRTEYLKNPIGLGTPAPRLYWNCTDGITQTAYALRGNINGVPFSTGKISGNAMTHIPFPASVNSRDRIEWQVQLWDEQNAPGAWSDCACFEMGLLHSSDWKAKWITSAEQPKKNENAPADCFQKVFVCAAPQRARIYAAACGIYELRLNGQRVGDAVLTPGATDIRKRVQYQTFDVTSLLLCGENVLTAQLAPGWLYSQKQPGTIDYTFGRERKLLVQLEMTDDTGKTETVVSDDTWDWSNDGPVLFADNKGGEEIDARKAPSYGEKAKVTGATFENAPTKQEMAHRALARRAAQEGIVLLKNQDHALPLCPGKLAVYGAGASMTVKGGTGSGEVNERYTVSILQGLENAGFVVTTKQWIQDFEAEYTQAKEAYAQRKAKTSLLQFKDVINIMNDPLMLPAGRVVNEADISASDTDTALYIVARQAGEGTDKKLDKSNSVLDERTLREIYLRGFEICVKDAHPASVMSSYNKLNGVYSPNCKELLTDVLRCEWGFDGIVMTDWYSTGNGLGSNDGAIRAGNDLIMPGMSANTKEILRGLQNGTVTRTQLRISAGRIVKQLLDSNAAVYTADQFV